MSRVGMPWRSLSELIKTAMEQNPCGERPRIGPKNKTGRLGQKGCIAVLGGDTSRKERAMTLEEWM